MADLNVISSAVGVANIVGTAAQFVISVPTYRAIGDIKASATIQEKHEDELVITEHPVENGEISDHAYKRPGVVVLNVGWSRSDPESGYDNVSYLRDIYDKLLTLQNSKVPFSIYTGKRTYNNMLIKSLATTTDDKTSNVLLVTLVCRQVFIVETTAVAVTAKQSDQLHPEDTSPMVDTGVHGITTAPYFDASNLVGVPL